MNSRTVMQRIITYIIALAAVACIFASVTVTTHAEGQYKLTIPKTIYHNRYFSESWAVYVGNKATGNESIYPTKVKSSNPKVLKIAKGEVWSNRVSQLDYSVEPKKSGKVVLTVTFNDENGISRTIQRTTYVKKYPTFIKSLKINGKKMPVKTDVNASTVISKKSKAKIKFTLTKGWKITGAFGQYCPKGKKDNVLIPATELNKIMKGKTFSFPKKYKRMYVFVEMKKGDDYLDYCVEIKRSK